ncbi:MAG: glycosyltransferase family 2 protein [Clostridia bacterium]|nr:glycosyltransferase family 2 protein [Clostridia bacterium]
MKYSVIIPAFQCADSIENTVKSVLDSGLKDFEIIIVDDGSKDGTEDICDRLEKKHSQVTCIHKENGGVSSARNRGIDAAQGEYILFIDSDDTLDTNGLTNAAKLIEKHKPDMLIFGLSFDFYKNNSLYRRDEFAFKEECLLHPSQWSAVFHELFSINALSPVWNKFYKSEIIKNNYLVFQKDVFIMEDFLFVTDYLRHTDNIYLLPEIIYRYRQPDDETRIYTRLNRINDLNAYLTPFYNSMENLEIALKEKYDLDFHEGEKVLFNLYRMILSQKASCSGIAGLKKLSETLNTGKWADYDSDDILIRDLKAGKFCAILVRYKKIHLRHKIAVSVKKTKLFQALFEN